jgi:predicted component of type VI protein secretion system
MPVRLIPIANGKPIKLDKPVVLVGRNPDCDVILTRSRKVSRAHCIVACVENTIVVRDLGSTNGVWLNGHRVERESSLRLGDELSIADVRYQLLNVERNGSNPEIPIVKSKKKKQKEQAEIPVPRVVSPAERIGEHHEERIRRSDLRPIDMSQNVPVAIPDEDDSFVIEASAAQLPKPSALAKLEEEANPKRRRSRRRPPDDSSCDVIPLENQSPATDDDIPMVSDEGSSNDIIIPLDEPHGKAEPLIPLADSESGVDV